MKLLEVELVSADLDGQQRFYAETLRLPVTRDQDRLDVQVGATRLGFVHGSRSPGPYHLAFDVPEHRFDEAATWLRERTPLLSEAGQETYFSEDWNAHMLYFRDADGNILELIARHTLPRPQHAGLIVNVSEVGLAVPDIAGARLTLEQTFGLEPYLEPSPRFAATGTHEGLLIVVDAGRPWFPTADAARPLPLRVLAQTPQAGAVRLAQEPVQLTGVTVQLTGMTGP